MSCVSALKENGFIYFACDSQRTDTRSHYNAIAKWIKFENSIVAVVGDSYVMTVIETTSPFRGIDVTRQDIIAYLLELKASIPNDLKFAILIGGNSSLYRITNAFDLIEVELYDSIGSGQDIAIGSLFSTTGSAQARVETSVRAAIAYNPCCGGQIFTDRI